MPLFRKYLLLYFWTISKITGFKKWVYSPFKADRSGVQLKLYLWGIVRSANLALSYFATPLRTRRANDYKLKGEAMRKLTIHHRAWRYFEQFWAKCYPLAPEYVDWALEHVAILEFDRYQTVCLQDEVQRHLYFVCQGLLARSSIDLEIDRRILYQVFGPHQAAFTRSHRHWHPVPPGDLMALKKTFAIRIPYKAVHDFVPQDKALVELVRVLDERNREDHRRLSDVKAFRNAAARYRSFFYHMPDYRHMLTIHQQADLLEISATSVKNFQRILLKEKCPQEKIPKNPDEPLDVGWLETGRRLQEEFPFSG